MSQGYIPGTPSPHQRQEQPTQPKPQQFHQPVQPAYQQFQNQVPQQSVVLNREKKDIFLLISGILGLAYAIYLIVYFGGINNSSMLQSADTLDGIGNQLVGLLAVRIVTPHIIAAVVAAILNVVAWYLSNKWIALVCAIMYCVAALLFMSYAPILILPIILAFIGFIRLHKRSI